MGPIGAQEMFLIFLVALLLFGPKKLPELGRMLGKGLTEFRRAKNELKTTFEGHMRELEREANVADEPEKPKWDQPDSSYSEPYSYTYDEYGRNESAEAAAEPASSTPAPSEPVAGTVPRSSPSAVPEPVSAAKDENHAA
jgi:TatA/E family protein of Tat protein translocase